MAISDDKIPGYSQPMDRMAAYNFLRDFFDANHHEMIFRQRVKRTGAALHEIWVLDLYPELDRSKVYDDNVLKAPAEILIERRFLGIRLSPVTAILQLGFPGRCAVDGKPPVLPARGNARAFWAAHSSQLKEMAV